MKLVFSFILIFLCGISNLQGQSISDSMDYNRGIGMMELSKTMDNYLDAAHYFEKLAVQYPGQWLALYYAGLNYLYASYNVQGNSAKDGLIDKVQPLIDKAFKLKPGEPEIHILQAFLYQSRLQVNPIARGLSFSQQADASLKKAIATDPSNPRALLLSAYNVYFTPVIFGGGPKNALPLFMKARDKFLVYAPVLPFFPNWGEEENQQMINTCKKAMN